MNTNTKVIVVATAGHVLLGEPEQKPHGIELREASIIRVWGTTRGLGQIALCGPTKETVLDPVGTVFIPTHAVIMRITCTY
jgi:energy-converting hydrogenase Eha subunit C